MAKVMIQGNRALIRKLAAVSAAVGALAGCGGGSAATGHAAPTQSSTPTVTTTVTTSHQPQQATTTATSSGNPAACADGSIDVSVGQQGAGLGNNFTVLLFRNVTDHICDLRGYPGVTPYVHSEAGTPAKRTTSGYFGSTQVRTIVLRSGHFASALVNGSDNPTDGKRSCPTYTSLRVTPPNMHDTVTLNIKDPACARLSVEPVTSGKRGSPTR